MLTCFNSDVPSIVNKERYLHANALALRRVADSEVNMGT